MYEFFERPFRVLKLSNVLLIGGLVALIVGAILAYGLDRYLSLPGLIAAHAMTILGPTAIKIGYVMRLQSFNRLRREAAAHLHGFAR
ncbi:transmembrane sensor/regulator PpyR [Pseudomonas sp. REP124]|uniref:transmembrane sensor/regulator PpyR n=1 Tax=Pseudomonas sp. REP124 TaxID=2875731 RepID=UPI001CCA4B26|nr:transmembrane sensor/regulator PpyR [Pseudomonas sp. REP124]MBZ9780316.1 transmembrane sensor/regulator PpyR [Pseudomonas sp. REP124]